MNDQWAVKDMHPKFTNTGSTNDCMLCEATARKLAVAVEALQQILEFGNKAHADGSSHSHSFNLGLSAGAASKALSKIGGEKC
jgi:3-hydroxyisobutyrate dehydrogenase-like beta-hydroxyacid dehydrogenase